MSSPKKQVMERYNETSEGKAKKFRDPFYRFYYRMASAAFVRKHVDAVDSGSTPIRILDVGTGAGLYVYFVRGSNREIVGIDLSSTAVETASRELGDEASFMLGDGEQLGFADDTFDVVLAMGTAEYVKDLSPMLAEFSRVLRPSGRVVLSAHNADSLRSSDNKGQGIPAIEYSIAELETALEEHGFKPEGSRTVHTVPNQFKLGFMSDRVPRPIRWLLLLVAVGLERVAESTPGIRNRGSFSLMSASSESEG